MPPAAYPYLCGTVLDVGALRAQYRAEAIIIRDDKLEEFVTEADWAEIEKLLRSS